jgi:hypothetical protein
MSNDTARSTSRNSEQNPALTIACAGFCSAALQSVYFRELLSVFCGNELSIGIIFSVWLLATGSSAALANGKKRGASGPDLHSSRNSTPLLVVLLCTFTVTGFFCIRLCRLILGSGIAAGPLVMLGIIAMAVMPFTFINGLLIGTLFSTVESRKKPYGILYGAENSGAIIGALCVFMCIILYAKNSIVAAVCLVPFLFIAGKRLFTAGFVLFCMACLVFFDHASLSWKYPGIAISQIVYGREGEIVSVASGADTTLLFNGTPYRSTMDRAACEQAVHVPMAQRPQAAHALVLFDRGQAAELLKYPGLSIDIIETEPALARKTSGARARVAAVETMRPSCRYDAIFLGTGIPKTAAENRFYTRSFFLKMKSHMTDSGLITFSLAFSENYLGKNEQKLYNSLLSTLFSVWKNVAVFPGEGYTFMASDGACLAMPSARIPVATEYLASSIIPAISPERIASANKRPGLALINTSNKPITLLLGLHTWLEQFKYSIWLIVGILCAAGAAILFLLPKSRSGLSVATSGFTAGIYSICLLLLYQATFGALYSRISLLLVSLTAGFALGSFIKKFALSDFFIGLYAVVSLWLLATLPSPPAFLFYLFHAGIGLLAGAQFVSRGAAAPAALYAADMLGGAIGMAVCSTILVPLFGILIMGTGTFILKIIVEIINSVGDHFTSRTGGLNAGTG